MRFVLDVTRAARDLALLLAGGIVLVLMCGCEAPPPTAPTPPPVPPPSVQPQPPSPTPPPTPPVVLPPGCDAGTRTLTRPDLYFFSVLGKQPGERADDFVDVLLRSGIPGGPVNPGEKSNPAIHFGITQQRGGDGLNGRVVGRLFLPTDLADGNGYFTRPVDILGDVGNGPGTGLQWIWREWGTPPYTPSAPPYAPRPCP
jgi:hypothetical protein